MNYEHSLSTCLLKDRPSIKKRLSFLESLDQRDEKDWIALSNKIATSQAIYQARLTKVIDVSYPSLPIVAAKDIIMQAIETNPVVIISGETGSGKSTQLAKMCIELGRGLAGQIGHTQPRRLAARTIADRVASEFQQPIGETVGFQVRFQDVTAPHTRIKVMTDGILLNELSRDRLLLNYDTLIIDEVHERSLNIDIILGYLKLLLKKRTDLKIIITSATLAVEALSEFFDAAPVLKVPGKMYPVSLRYLPNEQKDDLFGHILRSIDLALKEGRGDILVFLTGEGEIHQLQKMLRQRSGTPVEVCPLYAKLNLKAQRRVFQSSNLTKVILSTNVAETSLTVPNIRYVIDPGFARVSRYSYRSKIQRLPIEPVSQASATQRMGRAGRLQEGICFRLYSETDFQTRPLFTEPEIQRTDLAAVLLQMSELKLGAIEDFPLLDPPDPKLVRDGIRHLERLGALDEKGHLTPIGKQMARLPIEPKLSRILIEASTLGALHEILIIVSVLSLQDPREFPKEKLEAARQAHAVYKHPKSSFLSYIQLWNHIHNLKKEMSASAFKNHCFTHYLNFVRILEWQDLYHQFKELSINLKCTLNMIEAPYDAVHRSLLSGLFETIGCLNEKGEYQAARGTSFVLPKNALMKKPNWLLAFELIETQRVFAAEAAEIEAVWIEQVVGHLCKAHIGEMSYEPKLGIVRAHERVTFFGLTVVTRRPAKIQPEHYPQAQEIFIRHGLIEHGFPEFQFWQQNYKTIQYLRELEVRIRKPDALFDEQALFDFYKKKLPVSVYSLAHLKTFLQKEDELLLKIAQEEICYFYDIPNIERDFPATYSVDGLCFEVAYLFDLSSDRDGATLVIPFEAVAALRHHDFSWGLVGSMGDRLEWILRMIPKQYRQQLPSRASTIQDLRASMDTQSGFHEALKFALAKNYQVHVPLSILKDIELPAHLNLHFRITQSNQTVYESSDWSSVLNHFQKDLPKHLSTHVTTEAYTSWSFGDIPESVIQQIGNQSMTVYPALVDKTTHVQIEYFSNAELARTEHYSGLTRLLMLVEKQLKQALDKSLDRDWLKKEGRKIGCLNLLDQMVWKIFSQTFLDAQAPIRTAAAFMKQVEQTKPHLMTAMQDFAKHLSQSFECLVECQRLLLKVTREKEGNFPELVADLDSQLSNLFSESFIKTTPMEWLQRYPSYLKAFQMRIDRLLSNPNQDNQRFQSLKPLLKAFNQLSSNAVGYERIRWAIEEFRVTLFAQPLKARMPVSQQKIHQWILEAL